jgi:cbb3-type cytochrome oxidase subunit 3
MINNLWQYIQNHTPTVATIFFFIFFCIVVYSVFKKGQEDKFDKYSKIPLNDEPKKQSSSLDKNQSTIDLSSNNKNTKKFDK